MNRYPFAYPLHPANVSILVIGVVASLIIHFIGTNLALFSIINPISNVTGEYLWVFFSLIADTRLLVALLLIFIAKHFHIVWAYLLMLIPGAFLTQGVKIYLGFDRPARVIEPEQINIIGETLLHDAFPSGHTTTIFALLALILASNIKPSLKSISVIIASCSGVSRIAVGAHWPIDVLTGASLGIGLGLIAVLLLNRFPILYKPSLRAQQIVSILCLSFAVSVFFRNFDPFADFLFLEYSVTVCIILWGLWFFPKTNTI